MSSLGLLEDGLQIGGNGERLEGAGVGAAGVTCWHPAHRRFGGSANDAKQLANDFATPAMAACPDKHLGVHAHMLDRGGLAEHVGPFEMLKTGVQVPQALGILRCPQLPINGWTNAFAERVHCYHPSGANTPAQSDEDYQGAGAELVGGSAVRWRTDLAKWAVGRIAIGRKQMRVGERERT